MNTVSKQIKNFIQLHTSDMESEDYIALMRELAEWATSQADIPESPVKPSGSYQSMN